MRKFLVTMMMAAAITAFGVSAQPAYAATEDEATSTQIVEEETVEEETVITEETSQDIKAIVNNDESEEETTKVTTKETTATTSTSSSSTKKSSSSSSSTKKSSTTSVKDSSKSNTSNSTTSTDSSSKKTTTKKVKVKKKTKKLTAGKTFKLKTLKMFNGKKMKNYTFKSSKKSVATVNKNGVVKAKKKGTAIIVVRNKADNTKYAKITIKVKAAPRTYTSSELRLMSAIIFCEAGNQSYAGKKAVGIVVMNRMRSSLFPNTLSGVIYQSGQFTPAASGFLSTGLYKYDNGMIPSSCIKAAKEVLSGSTTVELNGSTVEMKSYLFFSRYVYGCRLQIGAHQFK